MENQGNYQKAIIEGNSLIAKFMDAIIKKQTIHVTSQFESPISEQVLYHIGEFTYTENHLRYNSSWDWLMPVVEKIARCQTAEEEVVYNGEDSYFDNYYPRTFGMMDSQTKQFMVRINRFPLHKSKTLIEATWFAVVEFIKSFNERGEKI
jgi:hypothetical protein